MTTSTFTAAPTMTNMIWAKYIHDGLIAIGLVQTSDTGQLSLVSPPTHTGNSGTVYGYTMYRWNDALQATNPLFLRITWRNATISFGAGVGLDLQLGTGSNGSGTITGTGNTISMQTYGASVSTTYPSYMCYSNGTLVIALFDAAAQNRLFYSVDRMRDADGTPNAHGVVVTNYYGSSEPVTPTQYHYSVVTPGSIASPSFISCYVPYAYFHTNPSLIQSNDVPVFGHTFMTPHANHILGVVTVAKVDIAPDTSFTVTRLGAAHTYRATGIRTQNCGYSPSNSSNATPATQSTALSLAYLYE